MSPFRPQERLVRRAVVRYVLGAVVVLMLVVLASVLVAGRIADREALEHAEVDARTLATEYVVPLGADELDPESARQQLDEVFGQRIADGALTRVKIWADAGEGRGRIVYSDDRSIEGAVEQLDDEHVLFGGGGAHAERVTDKYGAGTYPDGTYEVYVGFRDGRGTPYIFEAYLPTPDMALSRGETLRDWLPLVVGSLGLLALATLPLAVRLARRTMAVEAERSRLARRALGESLADRRRLAQRLHDGVVQELSGVGLALDSIDRDALRSSDQAMVGRATAIVRRQVGELRSLGDDLFPDAVSSDALEEAVAELRRGLGAEGVALQVRVEVDDDLGLDEDGTFLVFRVVREGVRNVLRHAVADAVDISIRRAGDGVAVTVVDDGLGPASGTRHGLGLRLLAHEVRERGGSLELTTADPRGAELRVELP